MKALFTGLSLFVASPSYADSFPASSYLSANTHIINAIFVIVVYVCFCAWIIWRYKKRNALNQNEQHLDLRDENSILVAYASQTGNAEQLANKTAESLKQARLSVEIYPLSAVGKELLQAFTRVLFVVSTTGEGDAPDDARDFLTSVMHHDANFPQLRYGILALGDKNYTHYCRFGHTLDTWLQHTHALPLFDIVEVDRHDDGALRHWQYQLSVLAKDTEMADWQAPDYQHWKLTKRTQLNKGSVGAPVYHLSFSAQEKNVSWQAGDIAEIGPRNSPESVAFFLERLGIDGSVKINSVKMTFAEALQDKLLPHDEAGFNNLNAEYSATLDIEALLSTLKTLPHREYSIASIPQDGALELLVRQTHYVDGRLGIGSGWLTQHASINGDIALRIRENSAFHPPPAYAPLILIGNGTGIAGLRAHLKARANANQSKNWLIFGERNAEYDFYFKDELYSWQRSGVLNKLETAFSRDQSQRMYVQDTVKASAADISNWVNDGAAIYVCGSASGMAPAVHAELLEILGENTLSTLTTSGRYRRDVY